MSSFSTSSFDVSILLVCLDIFSTRSKKKNSSINVKINNCCAAVVGPEKTMLRLTCRWPTTRMLLQPYTRQSYVLCTTIVRQTYGANGSYIRCTLITLTQFLTLRSATEPRLEKPITHKRSVNTYGQLWLRHLTCSWHIIFENIFFLVKRLEIGYENEIHYTDFFPIEYNDVFTCI